MMTVVRRPVPCNARMHAVEFLKAFVASEKLSPDNVEPVLSKNKQENILPITLKIGLCIVIVLRYIMINFFITFIGVIHGLCCMC